MDTSDQMHEPYACCDDPRQEMVLVILPKISASLSVAGSTYIITAVFKKWQTEKESINPYHRIMAAYSVYDIIFTFFYYFLGTWMVPAETGWFGAVGTTVTCSIQGFSYAFAGPACLLYQVLLSLQMMLLVSYNWSTRRFEERIEYRMHLFIMVVVLVVALVPLFYQGYNPRCGRCALKTLPHDCNNTTACVRGDVTLEIVYNWLEISVIFLVTIFCTVAMIVIYRSVYNQEKRMARYNIIVDSDTEDQHRRSRHIRKSMILYTSSFYICWIAPHILYLLFPDSASARIAHDVLVSLMGVFNSLVFIMPKCIKYQKDHSGSGLLKAYICVIFSSPIELCNKLREDFASKRDNISSMRTVDLSEADTPLL